MVEEGMQFASSTEIGEWIGCSPAQVSTRLRGARQANEMLCVTNGGWVPVVNGHINIDAFIDPMMQHLGYAYYVTGLAGAVFYGAAHQAIFTTHIATNSHSRSRVLGGKARIKVYYKENTAQMPVRIKQTRTLNGNWYDVKVGEPEVILFDLLSLCPYRFIDSQLNVFCEMVDPGSHYPQLIDPEKIARIGLLHSVQARQRVGFLLDQMSDYVRRDFDSEPLRSTIPSKLRTIDLEKDPDRSDSPVFLCDRWKIRLWDELYPDITC